MFDLHLIIFRSIKDELETKIDFDMSLNDLLEKGLIKNHRYPFFYFKDNRNNRLNIFADEKLLKEIHENEEALLCYKKYLPRNNTVNFIMKNPVNKLILLMFRCWNKLFFPLILSQLD